MITDFIEYLRQRLPQLKQIGIGLIILIIVWSTIFVDKHHAHTKLEYIPGFWSFFGLISCVVLIYVANWFGKSGISTREDYYDE